MPISYDGIERLWRVHKEASGQELKLKSSTEEKLHLEKVAFSPDGQWLGRSYDKTMQLWRLPEGTPGFALKVPSFVEVMAFSPDGQWFATSCEDNTVRLWRMPDGLPGPVLEGHLRYAESVVFSPDGKWLVGFDNNTTMRLWRLPEGQLVASWCLPENTVEAFCIQEADGQLFIHMAVINKRNRPHIHHLALAGTEA